MRPLFFLLFFFTSTIFAQPGGGGGIAISKIYDVDGKAISIEDIQVRMFFLKNGKIEREYFPKPGYVRWGVIYVPPLTEIDWEKDADLYYDYRVLLTYKKQVMSIDFLEVAGENGMGRVDGIDSLQFFKGEHFIYHRDMLRFGEKHPKEFELLRKTMRNGLTNNNLLFLKSKAVIQQKRVDLSLFNEDKLPYTFFLYRAQHYVSVKDSINAFADIEKLTKMYKGGKDCTINYLLADAYALVKRYPEAITALSESLHCKRYRFDPYYKEDNYRRRALLYIENGELEKALGDYNMLVKVAEVPTYANIERAYFKIKYLNNPAIAIADLQADVDKIPTKEFEGRTEGWLFYADTYFALGNAYYAQKDSTAAFKSWLTAMELGYSSPNSSPYAIEHFDSLIAIHPKEPLLYLSRALAHCYQAPYLGWGEDTKKALGRALADLESFKRLGPKDIRYHIQRAHVLCLLKEGQSALEEANAAVEMNPEDPRGFMKRYQSRRELGQVIWGNHNDVDYVKYSELLKKWRYTPN